MCIAFLCDQYAQHIIKKGSSYQNKEVQMMRKTISCVVVGLCLLVFSTAGFAAGDDKKEKGQTFKANETAIVLIEFQNEMLKPGGKNYEWLKPVVDKNNVLGNAVDLVDRARVKGVRILHVPIWFETDYRDMGPAPYGVGGYVKSVGAFKRDTWATKIVDELTPGPNDIVIEGKRAPDAFGSSNLDWVLRSLGIKNVAIAGFVTNICVESTMRTAYEKGYTVITMTDVTAAGSQAVQDFTVKENFPTYSFPMTHDEFLAKVK
jgi:ureidoacrylate peracid hydrolase